MIQHPLMPPYGTPVPYPAVYPPGGVYAHPGISMVITFYSKLLMCSWILEFVYGLSYFIFSCIIYQGSSWFVICMFTSAFALYSFLYSYLRIQVSCQQPENWKEKHLMQRRGLQQISLKKLWQKQVKLAVRPEKVGRQPPVQKMMVPLRGLSKLVKYKILCARWFLLYKNVPLLMPIADVEYDFLCHCL